MKIETQPELAVKGGQQRLSRSQSINRHVEQFWNPQNHPNEFSRPIPDNRRQVGNIHEILAGLEQSTSKRDLGRKLQAALRTILSPEERKKVLTKNREMKSRI